MATNAFVGTKPLLKLALRRDRIKLPIWILAISLFIAMIIGQYAEISPDERHSIVRMASESEGMRLLVSPISSGMVSELGTFFLFRTSFLMAILIGLMSIQIVLRHTRQNEETGCTELIRSTVTGPYALPAAALILAVATNLTLALLLSFVFLGNGLPATGSFLTGFTYGLFGIVFAGFAAVAAQMSESSRGASGLASTALASAFFINAIGNISGKVHPGGVGFESAWLVWLSPLGWVQQTGPFDQNNGWIPLLSIPLFLLLTLCAFFLIGRRDVGRGLLSARKGPGTARTWMLSPLGLAWRLQRRTILAWAVPITLVALLFGSASHEFGETMENVERLQQAVQTAGTFRYLMIGVVSAMISIYTMQALMRKRSEEHGGPLESILAGSVKRVRWMMSHILCVLVGSLILLLTFTLTFGAASGVSASEVWEFVKFSLALGTGILVIAGFVSAAFGLLPRMARSLSWVGVMLGILTGPFFGALLGLPDGLTKLSPFTHVGMLPSDVVAGSLLGLLALAGALGVAGLVSFHRRNLSL